MRPIEQGIYIVNLLRGQKQPLNGQQSMKTKQKELNYKTWQSMMRGQWQEFCTASQAKMILTFI